MQITPFVVALFLRCCVYSAVTRLKRCGSGRFFYFHCKSPRNRRGCLPAGAGATCESARSLVAADGLLCAYARTNAELESERSPEPRKHCEDDALEAYRVPPYSSAQACASQLFVYACEDMLESNSRKQHERESGKVDKYVVKARAFARVQLMRL